MRRLLPLLLLSVLVLLLAPGCPLDIRVRCDEANACGQGQTCVQGGCLRVDAERVGDDCDSDAECGPGFTCGTGFPGGYCLLACSESRACPQGSVCATELGQCLRACGETCTRSGYTCGPVPSSTVLSACVPVTSQGDGGCTGGACSDAGTDGGCTGAGCGDGGADAGCLGSVGVGGTCSQACDCANAAAACEVGVCTLRCESDFTCRDERRCTKSECVVGPRLGEACADTFECSSFAFCPAERKRCEETCTPGANLCESGYQCAPDGLCVRACTGSPATVGEVCENSMDCAPCSVCLTSGAALRCRQPCRLDRECPGGAEGACEQVGDTKACRL